MKNLPVLKYNDLQDLICLDDVCDLNGVVIDDASLEVMLRIEKTMPLLCVKNHHFKLVFFRFWLTI